MKTPAMEQVSRWLAANKPKFLSMYVCMEQRLEPRCPFCREELRGTDEEIEKD